MAMIMKKLLACLILLWPSVDGAMASEATPAIAKDLAPSGRLRAAINFGNPVLVQKDKATGEPRGVSPDLARELARRLGLPLDFIPFDGAGKVVEALKNGAWDIAFLAIDPGRAEEIAFTAPYVVIEGTYLVPAASPITTIEDADKAGVRIAVVTGSAYHLFLKRAVKHATLVEAPDGSSSVALLGQGRADAAAGIRQALASSAAADTGLRVIPGRFMAINQAMAAPKGREAGSAYLRAYVEEMKASGFVAKALSASGQAEAVVAPPSNGK
jgi:polar amino acid transport system substrate-binding protein